jgi:hypothetical protein
MSSICYYKLFHSNLVMRDLNIKIFKYLTVFEFIYCFVLLKNKVCHMQIDQ